MVDSEALTCLDKLPKVNGQYRHNYSLKHLTWFQVGGNAEIFFKPSDYQDLASFLLQNNGKLPVTIIGAGSNIIIRDGQVDGVTIKLGKNFANIELIDNDLLAVGSGCLNYNLARFALENSIAELEFLIGIPGTIGGGVSMNAGAYGAEFKDVVVRIEALNSYGKSLIFSNEEIGFRYRHNNLPKDIVITKAFLRTPIGKQAVIQDKMHAITGSRSLTQPVKERTGGSTFANPTGHKAWQLIDEAGMRGHKIGDASMSELHCNFMINHGNASARDLESLGNFVQQAVREHSGVELRWEIKRIGSYE